jgi:hypothetical protein
MSTMFGCPNLSGTRANRRALCVHRPSVFHDQVSEVADRNAGVVLKISKERLPALPIAAAK